MIEFGIFGVVIMLLGININLYRIHSVLDKNIEVDMDRANNMVEPGSKEKIKKEIIIPNLKQDYIDDASANEEYSDFGIVQETKIMESVQQEPKENLAFAEENIFNRFTTNVAEKTRQSIDVKTIK